jgi:hypothetical protein
MKNPTDQRLEILRARAKRVPTFIPNDLPRNLADRVLSQSYTEPDEFALWLRFSLASLPIGACVMLACLLWYSAEASPGPDELAGSFVQAPLLP